MTNNKQIIGSDAKLSEALELLNEAAKEKRDELQELMANKYSHIREAMSSVSERGNDVLKMAQGLAQETFVKGSEKVSEVAVCVDKRVHQDPWVYIAGAAAASLLVGYLIGSKRK